MQKVSWLHKWLICFSILYTLSLCGFEKLPDDYLIIYGDINSNNKVVEYFSFACDHCISIYRKEFSKIKSELIDTGKICWIFHPMPVDFFTIQAIICLEKLSSKNKEVFFESIMELYDSSDRELNVLLLKKAMECFEFPLPQLHQDTFITTSKAYLDAYKFIQQDDVVDCIPCVEINGKMYKSQTPNFEFIKENIHG